jgi:Uma2 family endonuclease
MSATTRQVHYSYAEYLALENHATVRHEYLDGEIYAMAGGSPDHAALAAAVIALLAPQLPSGCRLFTSDLRVRIVDTGLSTYPDAAVVCGATERASDDGLAVVNPVLVVEVTSPSTEAYDRGDKLRHYKSLRSLREVLFVSHAESRLTLHRKEGDAWTTLTAGPGEKLALASLSGELAVDELYGAGFEDS